MSTNDNIVVVRTMSLIKHSGDKNLALPQTHQGNSQFRGSKQRNGFKQVQDRQCKSPELRIHRASRQQTRWFPVGERKELTALDVEIADGPRVCQVADFSQRFDVDSYIAQSA